MESETYLPLAKTTSKKFKEYPAETVFVATDEEGRIKTVVVKDELFDWVFNREIVNPGKRLCELWDFDRFKPMGFKGKLVYKNEIEPGTTAGQHYHLKKRELFFVISRHGKLAVHLTRVKDGKQASIELSSDRIDIDGMPFSLAIRLYPGTNHGVANQGKRYAAILLVIANRSHDSTDDYRMEG